MHRHLGHDGERGHAGGQEPRSSPRSPRSSSRPTFPESNVIVETLERVTDPQLRRRDRRAPRSAQAIDAGIPPSITDAAAARRTRSPSGSRRASASRWLRDRPALGARAPADRRPRRSTRSAKDAGRAVEACRDGPARAAPRLEPARGRAHRTRTAQRAQLLRLQAAPVHLRRRPRLRDARAARASASSPSTASSSSPAHPTKRLYPVHFCRDCGHEYHPVRLVTEDGERRLPRARHRRRAAPRSRTTTTPADDATTPRTRRARSSASSRFTRPMPTSTSPTATRTTRRPGSTSTPRATPRSSRTTAARRAQRVRRRARPARSGAGTRAWFLPGKFRFCLRCGDDAGQRGPRPQPARVALGRGPQLGHHGPRRSALRWMHGGDSGLEPYTRKLLGFTDNRQDAALQAGHFNDFLFVSLIRAGFLGALEAAGDSGPAQRRARRGAAAGARLRPADAASPRRVAARADASRASTSQEAESDAPRGARLPRLVRPAARLALHEPEPRAARAASRSTTSASTSSPRTRRSSRTRPTSSAHATPAVRAGGLPRALRPPAEVDGDPQPGARADRRRAAARASRTAACGRRGASASTRSRAARAG